MCDCTTYTYLSESCFVSNSAKYFENIFLQAQEGSSDPKRPEETPYEN
jgi:hypothetical protein